MTILKTIFRTLPLVSALFGTGVLAAEQSMPSMPMIKEKRTFTVTSDNNLQAEQGFGDREPQVKMMNLMMVEGSGMEGMSMDMRAGKQMAENEKMQAEGPNKNQKSEPIYLVDAKIPASPKVGNNAVEISVLSPKDKKPVKGLKLKAQVFMTSMDMGTEEPPVKESKNGNYEVKAPFAMKGPWAVKIIFPDQTEKTFNFNVNSGK
jgi:hypothetical protein